MELLAQQEEHEHRQSEGRQHGRQRPEMRLPHPAEEQRSSRHGDRHARPEQNVVPGGEACDHGADAAGSEQEFDAGFVRSCWTQ